MSLTTTTQKLLTRKTFDQCTLSLLATFYRSLIALLPCYATGPQCLLVDLGIRLEEDFVTRDLVSFHQHLNEVLKVLASHSQLQGPPADIMRCNLDILKLRVSECLGICL